MLRVEGGIELPSGIAIRTSNRVEVIAGIQPLDRKTAKEDVDLSWWRSPEPSFRFERDRNWQWHRLIGTLRTQVGRNGFARAVRAEGIVQGAIIYQIGAVSELDPALPTLMIHRLATAPWNREWLRSPPLFRGVGSGLLRLAILHSHRYGMGGRVTVESDERLLEWYNHFGFQVAIPDDGEVCVLELAPDAARPLLERS